VVRSGLFAGRIAERIAEVSEHWILEDNAGSAGYSKLFVQDLPEADGDNGIPAVFQEISLPRFIAHRPDQAGRPHVRPVRGNVFKAFLASFLAVHHLPAGRYRAEGGPQRMLVLVVHQNQACAFFIVEWICHGFS